MTEGIGDYEYNSKDLIGHGAFAVVFKGRNKKVSLSIRTVSFYMGIRVDGIIINLSPCSKYRDEQFLTQSKLLQQANLAS
jgi:hypothetical protein